MLPSSFEIGCWPVSRSMIERRRIPRATPPSTWNPASSGPRWAMASVIERRIPGSAGLEGSTLMNPVMPHMGDYARGVRRDPTRWSTRSLTSDWPLRILAPPFCRSRGFLPGQAAGDRHGRVIHVDPLPQLEVHQAPDEIGGRPGPRRASHFELLQITLHHLLVKNPP